jgi:hypothetical protein
MEARKVVLLPANIVCLCGSNPFFPYVPQIKNWIHKLIADFSQYTTSKLLKDFAFACPFCVFVLRLKPSMRVPETECFMKPLLSKLNAYIKLWLFEIYS